jgi:hypothetical protein
MLFAAKYISPIPTHIMSSEEIKKYNKALLALVAQIGEVRKEQEQSEAIALASANRVIELLEENDALHDENESLKEELKKLTAAHDQRLDDLEKYFRYGTKPYALVFDDDDEEEGCVWCTRCHEEEFNQFQDQPCANCKENKVDVLYPENARARET